MNLKSLLLTLPMIGAILTGCSTNGHEQVSNSTKKIEKIVVQLQVKNKGKTMVIRI